MLSTFNSTKNMAHSLKGQEVVLETKLSVENIESSISSLLNTLPQDPSKSYTVCIFKVSEKHRKINKEAYTPRLVSIGPLHHGTSELQAMEAYKLNCLRNFIEHHGIDMTKLVKFAASEEFFVRGCYEGTVTLSKDELAQLIILDGIFVVELLLKSHSVNQRGTTDALYENRWMQKDILHDMLLLENQLPFTFLQKLFNSFVKLEPKQRIDFHDLVHGYYKDVGNTSQLIDSNKQRPVESNPRHIIESLVYLHWPLKSKTDIQDSQQLPTRKFEYTRSAAELEEAGVTFICGEGSRLCDVVFKNGALELPHLKVNDNTETFLRNAIAFEQCGYYGNNITSYVILMDSLINVGKDVDLLVKYNIIDNLVGESEKVADMFNNLYKEVVENEKDFYFAKICEDLNSYSKDKWHKWKATRFKWNRTLMRDYFGNPWSFISVVVASILVVLTVIQTVCAFGVC